MKLAAFEFYPDYNQFTVSCRAICGDDFYDDDWTNYDDGYSLHDGHATLFTEGRQMMDLEVLLADDGTVQLRDDAISVIQIPFKVEGDQGIDIGFYDNMTVGVPAGHYALIFENGYQGYPRTSTEIDDARLWGRIWFKPEVNAEAKALLRGGLPLPARFRTAQTRTEQDEQMVSSNKSNAPQRIRETSRYPIDFYPSTEFSDKYEYCHCANNTPVMLHYYYQRANPIFCIDCQNEIEPEQLRPVLDQRLLFNITWWRDKYVALEALSVDADYRKWAEPELNDIHSAINTTGLEIIKALEDNGLPSYYYWHYRDYENRYNYGYQSKTHCPKCNQAFELYKGGEYSNFICKTCKIITPHR